VAGRVCEVIVQYLGGKSRLAKRIVDRLPVQGAPLIWEPFMGGGAVTNELLARTTDSQALVCTDNCQPLIAMWQRVQRGWFPADLGTEPLTDEAYQAAKGLYDGDPYKAFVCFGCSFGGKWFYGNAKSAARSHYAESRRNLLGTARLLVNRRNVHLVHRSFFDVEPQPCDPGSFIYCDPPYAGTEGYKTGYFDSAAFWERCSSWVHFGWRVFVSELSCLVPSRLLLTIPRKINIVIGSGGATKEDKLFEVLP